MIGIITSITDFAANTNLPQQFKAVDAAIFANPWFIAPAIAGIGWLAWKQAFREIILTVIFVAIWYLSGTEYMKTLVIGDELQMKKVLPVMFGGACVLGLVIYMFFGNSD